jgi:hypothetical protein
LTLNPLKRIGFAIGLTAIAVALECSAAQNGKTAERFAAVVLHGAGPNAACAAMGTADLAIGQPVTVVILSNPQRLVTGSVSSKSNSSCTGSISASAAGSFYQLDLSGAVFEPGELGILIGTTVVSPYFDPRNGVLETNGARYKFAECLGREAAHLMVRSLSGHKSKLVWHDYLYLGYEVEPTCTEKDLAAIESLNR